MEDDYRIYEELLDIYREHGVKIVVDTAFCTTGEYAANLIKSRELIPGSRVGVGALTAISVLQR